jgi:two-component system response regulator DesR
VIDGPRPDADRAGPTDAADAPAGPTGSSTDTSTDAPAGPTGSSTDPSTDAAAGPAAMSGDAADPAAGPRAAPIEEAARTRTRVLLADDEQLTREAVAALLDLEGDLEVVAQADDADTAIEAIGRLRPDVAVLDVEMPGGGGLAVVERWASEVTCVMLTRHARPGVLRRALEAGARGFLAKSASASTLAVVIRRVAGGARYVDADLAADALTGDCPLTDRELDVLRLVRADASTDAIAADLHLSTGTVRNHVSAAITKLQVSSRSEAARAAHDAGWI